MTNKNFSSSDEDESSSSSDDTSSGGAKKKYERPSTGKHDRKKTKHMKPSADNENHVKNLRVKQFENRLLHTTSNGGEHDPTADINLTLKTAVNRTSTLESNAILANTLKLDLKSHSDSDSDLNTGDFLNSDDSDEKPFATNRNVSTVIVNQKRKPLELQNLKLDLVKEQKNGPDVEEKVNLAQQSETQPKLEITASVEEREGVRERAKSPKTVSDREKRVSDLVNSIKQKQRQHEQKKKFYSDFKPLIIGGGLFLGGVILHQIYKSFIVK